MMRHALLAPLACLVVSGYALAQDQPPAKSAAPSSAQPTLVEPHSKACKKEVKKLCGRRPGSELQSCLKDGIDLNKFTDDCKAEMTKTPPKSGS
jgi:hypothetical protein